MICDSTQAITFCVVSVVASEDISLSGQRTLIINVLGWLSFSIKTSTI